MINDDQALIPRPSPLVDPAQLAEGAADAIREILAAGASLNTDRSYRSALRYWAAWYLGRYGQPIRLPAPEAVVLQFVVDHLARPRPDGGWRHELPPVLDAALVATGAKAALGPWKRATIEHRLSVLAGVHRVRDLANPCEAPAVRQLLKRARRAAAQRGESPTKKAALTREPLEAMLATCDDSLEGLRDRALLLFGFASGGRRRSEIAAAQAEQLRRVGAQAFAFHLGISKTDQSGTASSSGGAKPLVGRAAAAVAAWLAAAGIHEGALFRRLWGPRVGPSLSPAAVGAIVQRRARLAGLGDDVGGHSLRSGFITEAGRQHVPLAEVMALSGHRSVASVMGYHRTGALTESVGARLLDDVDAPLSGPGETAS
jgi:integrase